jgi:hypothetical protein
VGRASGVRPEFFTAAKAINDSMMSPRLNNHSGAAAFFVSVNSFFEL